ncbi:MAG TPA: transcription elongation factor [Opitutaceae bacterium]|nr:transcription elongation factor [Opitutaceae bacterium]
MNKLLLRDEILARLQRELATQAAAAHQTRDEAISEESKAENKYDTRSIEAGYLAEGQARMTAEIQARIDAYRSFFPPDFPPGASIAVGALVEVESGGRRTWYFLGPRAGGMEIPLDGTSVLVLTPQSPLGRELLGRREGDAIAAPARGARAPQRIVRVE